MDDFQTLINFENLYNSYKVSLRGKGKKRSAARFNVMALENLYIIKQQLINHTYKISPYSEFIVKEPKQRIIKSGSFRDKVLQHCLCDYVMLPKMSKEFILDNYAGQIGKGTLFGLNRLSENLSNFYLEHKCNGYILKCDITKFFYTINHDIMKKLIRKHFKDEDIRWLCDLFIDSVDGNGLPLGNQSSQIFALIYLNGLDHYIKEELGCKYYGRYMDDFYLLSDDKNYLKSCLSKIKEYLSNLKLTLNDKTEIVPMSKGIRFLGFHSYLTEDGKIIRKLNGDNKRQIKKRLRKYAKLVANGIMTREHFDEIFLSWKNHASHGNCFKLIQEMDLFVDKLFGEEKMEIRIIIAGSRTFKDYEYLKAKLSDFIKEHPNKKFTIVSGMACGADQLGERFARENHIPIKRFYANWNTLGKKAGYIRNLQMLDYIDQCNCEGCVIAFWDGNSKGTRHIIKSAKKMNIPIIIHNF
jgi:hypothetical protein